MHYCTRERRSRLGSFVWDTIAGLFRCSVSVLVKRIVLGGFSSPASLYFDLRIRGHPQISSILPDDMQIPSYLLL